MTTVSAAMASRTRPRSSGRRSSRRRCVSAVSVTRCTARIWCAAASSARRAACSLAARDWARASVRRRAPLTAQMTSASSTKTPSRVTAAELSGALSAAVPASAFTPTIAPTIVVKSPGPSPPYHALSMTAPR